MAGEDDMHHRVDDPRIKKLVEDLEGVQGYVERINNQQVTLAHQQEAMRGALAENTALTAEMKSTVDQVKDILTSFRVLATGAKWVAAIGSAFGAIVVAWRQIKGG